MSVKQKQICIICKSEFSNIPQLSRHTNRMHGLIAIDYFKLINNLPTDYVKLCECGCGKETRFAGLGKGGYARFIIGHQKGGIRKIIQKEHQCPECIRSFERYSVLINHALREHDITLKHPHNSDNAPLCACGCGEKTMLRSQLRGTYSKYLSGHNNKGKPWIISQESQAKSGATRRKLRAEGKIKNWNLGLTKETDTRIAQAGEKISKAKKGKHRSPEHNAKIKAILDEYWSHEENHEKMRLKTIEVMQSQKSWSGQGRRFAVGYKDKKWLLRSSYEFQAFQMLLEDKNIIDIEYEPLKIKCSNKSYYVPDFFITFNDMTRKIIEVKSTFWMKHNNWPIKFKALKEYSLINNIPYEVWSEKTHKFVANIFEDKH